VSYVLRGEPEDGPIDAGVAQGQGRCMTADDDLVSATVRALRRRLPGRTDDELRAIVNEELVHARVRAVIAEHAARQSKPPSNER
jgi:hypothetical protein